MKPTFDIPVSPIRESRGDEGWWLPSTLDVVLYFGSLSERVQRDVVLLGGGLCDVYSSDGSRKERVKTIPLRRVPIESKILVPPTLSGIGESVSQIRLQCPSRHLGTVGLLTGKS